MTATHDAPTTFPPSSDPESPDAASPPAAASRTGSESGTESGSESRTESGSESGTRAGTDAGAESGTGATELSPTFRFFLHFWRTGRTLGDSLSARLERDHGLELRDYLVLNSIFKGRRYPTELAERLKIGKDVVSRIVNKLLQNGLIERAIDGEDSRRTRLTVSPTGLAQRDAVKSTIERTIAPVLEALGADRRDGMTDALESFNRLLQERLDDPGSDDPGSDDPGSADRSGDGPSGRDPGGSDPGSRDPGSRDPNSPDAGDDAGAPKSRRR